MIKKVFLVCMMVMTSVIGLRADNGSLLWLKQSLQSKGEVTTLESITPTLAIAIQELKDYWTGIPITLIKQKDKLLTKEGFKIINQPGQIIVISPSDIGLLYATYYLLRSQATHQPIQNEIIENPLYERRMLNHWDNLDRTIERGYAGQSLWEWSELPDSTSIRYQQYARANASIGINGTVLNNVNASPEILTPDYLQKVKAIADIFRDYGIQVYLSVNFASPMVIGGLSTADPLNKDVARWWKNKTKEIYQLIPDFGGFLVKANSEGQPGPCDYQRTHAQGANMLADALKPFGGVVMWRTFVYNPEDADRAKQAYLEFQPLDGEFKENVILQIKNGPVDFQPREPYTPLFGAMNYTQTMPEFQITQEYLGHANHLAYLAPMWQEFNELVNPSSQVALAGVANIGTDTNWTGHPFGQANWYAFGRLAWNPQLTSEQIADEWIRQTFTTDEAFIEPVKNMMLDSREAIVNYMMPLGLHHLFAFGHHYGPEPWCDVPGARPDWLPTYYHKADHEGLGFNRSSTGSQATLQYPDSLARIYDDIHTCPEEYILWFHHVPWQHIMKSGRTLWEELCYKYSQGVQQARSFQQVWTGVQPYVDAETFQDVQARLKQQALDAVWWRDACLLYFQQYAQTPIPAELEQPVYSLDEMKQFKLNIDNHENAPHGFK